MRWARSAVGLVVLALAIGYLVRGLGDADPVEQVTELVHAMLTDPAGPALALGCYALAFALRSWAWCAVLPGLRFGHSWAALHVSLLGNHVLPLRLGEVLRVTSVLRRTGLARRPVLASAVTLRAGDLAVVVVLAMLAAPALVPRVIGGWGWLLAAAGLCAAGGGVAWSWRLVRRGAALRLPSPWVVLAVVAAWGLESVVIWEIARIAGFPLSAPEALAVTSVTIVVQTVAVTPGGFGSYEAAATAVLSAIGVPAAAAFGTALVTHAVKTAYALAVGAVALFVPGPSYWGWLRLPPRVPSRPAREPVADDAPVVAFLPVHNEAASIGGVLARLPERVAGRPLTVVVVDDGSVDASAEQAVKAGAAVVTHPVNRGLGAAVRTGLAEAVAHRPAAVVYLDADGEYFPEDIDSVAGPVLAGTADYVVGSRFAGEIRRMLPHRRVGNRVLTVWVRWLTRRRDVTDGQSGYRAFSPEAAAVAEIVHDYNYAQVLTLDLLAKGFAYTEVPIRYTFRDTGTSFVKLGRYLRRVVPAVHRELNADRPRGGLLRAQSPAAR